MSTRRKTEDLDAPLCGQRQGSKRAVTNVVSVRSPPVQHNPTWKKLALFQVLFSLEAPATMGYRVTFATA